MKKCRKLVVLLLVMLVAFTAYPVKSVSAASRDTIYGGIDYSAVYDKDYYISHNPDVYAAIGNNARALLQHFVFNGMREGRQASDAFRLSYYKAAYSDLRAAFGNDNKSYYMHYVNSGKA